MTAEARKPFGALEVEMAYGRTFPARRRGNCGECGGQIKRGEEIKWDRSRKIACHNDCSPDQDEHYLGDGPSIGYQDGEPEGLTRSRYDRYGVYAADGTKLGTTCGCEDYPCCGH